MANGLGDYRRTLLRFAAEAPELLRRHSVTASFAVDVERLELAQQLDRKFTLAVIGRMRAGKSTLFNALMGRHMAPVGVNATTATINWFDHGDAGLEHSFDIFWRDVSRPSERWPLERSMELTGDSILAAQIQHLRFYATSEFLRSVRMVDTPGHDSLIDNHEAAANDFVRRRGVDRADAIVLALPAVVTVRDRDAVEAFARASRLPGQGPYNTVAVLQKWEVLEGNDLDGETWIAAEDRAQRIADDFAKRLAGHVSEVLPVSGLLWLVATHATDWVMDRIVALAHNSAQGPLELLFASQEYFLTRDIPGVALTVTDRKVLYEALEAAVAGGAELAGTGAYPILKYVLFLARRVGVTDAAGLRAEMRTRSNIDKLLGLLRLRFFDLSALIQAGSVLNQALAPCRAACDELRKELALCRKLTDLEPLVRSEMSSATLPENTARFVTASLPFLSRQASTMAEALRALHRLVDSTEGDFQLLLKDIECQELLASPSIGLDAAQVASGRLLFGLRDLDTRSRLGLPSAATHEEVGTAAHRTMSQFKPLCWSPDASVHRIAAHAVDRINAMLNEVQPANAASRNSHRHEEQGA